MFSGEDDGLGERRINRPAMEKKEKNEATAAKAFLYNVFAIEHEGPQHLGNSNKCQGQRRMKRHVRTHQQRKAEKIRK